MKHKQVPANYLHHEIMVDEGMKTLLERLWQNRIFTELSCQENQRGRAWIMFSNLTAFSRFYKKVVESDTQASANAGWYNQGKDCKKNWDYAFTPEYKGGKVRVDYSVRFPVEDIEELEAIFEPPRKEPTSLVGQRHIQAMKKTKERKMKLTQTEAVRLAVLDTLKNGNRVPQAAFCDNVQFKASALMREAYPDRLWTVKWHILGKGMALVPNLKFNNSARFYYFGRRVK